MFYHTFNKKLYKICFHSVVPLGELLFGIILGRIMSLDKLITLGAITLNPLTHSRQFKLLAVAFECHLQSQGIEKKAHDDVTLEWLG